jgi:hypothetical protein
MRIPGLTAAQKSQIDPYLSVAAMGLECFIAEGRESFARFVLNLLQSICLFSGHLSALISE